MTIDRRNLPLAGVTAAAIVVVMLSAAAVAVSEGPQGPAGPGAAAPVTGGGGAVHAIRIATETDPFVTASTSYIDLPGARVTIPVPAGATLITVDFTSETACYGGGTDPTDDEWCLGRINIGGIEAHPRADSGPSTFALDSTDKGSESESSWEGHAMSRSLVVRTQEPGFVRVQVRVRVTDFNGTPPSYWLDDFHLRATAYAGGFGLP